MTADTIIKDADIDAVSLADITKYAGIYQIPDCYQSHTADIFKITVAAVFAAVPKPDSVCFKIFGMS